MTRIAILRAGPWVTVQDEGRPGMLVHGVSASGALDRGAFALAGHVTGRACGAALEFSSVGVSFVYRGPGCFAGFAGGAFTLTLNGAPQDWLSTLTLADGDVIDISTGAWGNYGYVRFDRQIDVPPVMGSRATNAVTGLGGHEGRALVAGDELPLAPLSDDAPVEPITPQLTEQRLTDPVRVIWSLHADLFSQDVRNAFCATDFQVTAGMDRMGVRLKTPGPVFGTGRILSLVSDSVVPGDIQVLGDGTPIVLLRDHQPTGGYPRIATVIGADLDRFAQIRPGRTVRFKSVTLDTAHAALREAR